MNIKAELNGVKINKTIPTNYSELSFRDFVDISHSDGSQLSIAAIILGVDKELIRKVKVDNMEAFIRNMAFMSEPMPTKLPNTILGYPVPKDLNNQSWGRYGDLTAITVSFRKDGAMSKEDILKYAEIVAIYAMPNYEDSNSEEKEAFIQQFYVAPCSEVVAIGNFILLKLLELKMPTLHNYLIAGGTRMNKFKLALIIWRTRLGSFIRSTIWNVRHRIAGTNF